MDDVTDAIVAWHRRATIAYDEAFIKEYIGFNIWFRHVTGCSNDREGLTRFKRRFVIWSDYERGTVLIGLRPIVEHIAIDTTKSPFESPQGNAIVVTSWKDWPSLIEYWYAVRCAIIHGHGFAAHHARLAYESLRIYMGEITSRLKKSLSSRQLVMLRDLDRLKATHTLSQALTALHADLARKYVSATEGAVDTWRGIRA